MAYEPHDVDRGGRAYVAGSHAQSDVSQRDQGARPLRWVAAGLLVVIVGGALAFVLGRPSSEPVDVVGVAVDRATGMVEVTLDLPDGCWALDVDAQARPFADELALHDVALVPAEEGGAGCLPATPVPIPVEGSLDSLPANAMAVQCDARGCGPGMEIAFTG